MPLLFSDIYKFNSRFATYLQAGAYNAGDVVVHNAGIYRANGTIPAGTAFAVGTSGATWTPLGGAYRSVDTTWTTTEALTIAAVTTNPTKATTREVDTIRSRQVGLKEWECMFHYTASDSTGATAGSGHYLFNLPTGHTFDTTEHPPYTDTGEIDNSTMHRFAIETTGLTAQSGAHGYLMVMPYDASRFRLYSLYVSSSPNRGFIGSTWFGMNATLKVIKGRFKYFRP